VGVWETGEVEPELTVSAQMASAGRLLLAEGAFRCAGLGEVRRIDGYEREPTAAEMLGQQRRIWEANGVTTYKLLVAMRRSGEDLRQYHVAVEDEWVVEIKDADTCLPGTTWRTSLSPWWRSHRLARSPWRTERRHAMATHLSL
jgi:hypothetical protein